MQALKISLSNIHPTQIYLTRAISANLTFFDDLLSSRSTKLERRRGIKDGLLTSRRGGEYHDSRSSSSSSAYSIAGLEHVPSERE